MQQYLILHNLILLRRKNLPAVNEIVLLQQDSPNKNKKQIRITGFVPGWFVCKHPNLHNCSYLTQSLRVSLLTSAIEVNKCKLQHTSCKSVNLMEQHSHQ